jgi:hypothetical protein
LHGGRCNVRVLGPKELVKRNITLPVSSAFTSFLLYGPRKHSRVTEVSPCILETGIRFPVGQGLLALLLDPDRFLVHISRLVGNSAFISRGKEDWA